MADFRSPAQRLADARREFAEAHGLIPEGASRGAYTCMRYTHDRLRELVMEAIAYGFYAAPSREPRGMVVTSLEQTPEQDAAA